ncbi:hypothetical protein ACTWQB_16680 [Piscibacillus sp. B03]|uniref:hypothetical protein n=1 Tax=Piscibacillus sp. B03 TaxID=3457430 RepID=UPI003FCC84AD
MFKDNHKTIDTLTLEISEDFSRLHPVSSMRVLNLIILKIKYDSLTGGSIHTPSLKLVNNLHYFISGSINLFKKQRISESIESISKKVSSVELLYSVKNNSGNSVQSEIVQQAFHNYHFDYHTVTLKQYLNFFHNNKEVLNDLLKQYEISYEETIKGFLALLYFEFLIDEYGFTKLMKKNKKFLLDDRLFYVYPQRLVKLIFLKMGVDYNKFIRAFFTDLKSHRYDRSIYLTDLYKKNIHSFGVKYKRLLYFPRNYFLLDKLFIQLSEYPMFIKEKGEYLEANTIKVIKELYGEDNVYTNIYDGDGVEKDVIVTFGKYVLSFECKSKPLKEPFRDTKKSYKRLKQN